MNSHLFAGIGGLVLGLLSPWMIGVAVMLIASRGRRDLRRRYDDFVTAIGYTVFIAAGVQLHALLIGFTPRLMDATLLRADHALGFDPIAFAAATARHGLLMVPLILGYALLPLALAVGWTSEQNRTMRRAVFIGGILCFVFYALVPAVGPAWYNFATGAVTPLTPRNCMPSMHLTWALLLAVNAQARRWKAIFWVYAAVIAVATVALGQHYLIDLIAAVPYTTAVQWLAGEERWQTAVGWIERSKMPSGMRIELEAKNRCQEGSNS